MPPFSAFDKRGYRTVDARSGYGEWASTYEDTVEDAMDLDLLDVVDVEWGGVVADLGCGTGRTGQWLRSRVEAIDGVDLTPEMLARARERGVYRSLREGDVASTGLESGAYDIAVSCLVDEHLADLAPLYAEAARLARTFVLVGLHPHFIMAAGMPTHYDAAGGEPVAIETHVHLLSEHVAAARAAGLVLRDLRERVIDDTWVALKPKWASLRGHPVAFAFVWQLA
jgi:SAM-dependent methyltransferase